jgi:hypothetical protein
MSAWQISRFSKAWRDFQFAISVIGGLIWVALLTVAGIFALVRLIGMGW